MLHSSLDEYIAACLYGTRLPADRRRQAAEELRSHLEDCIAAKRKAGLDEQQSLQMAMSEFGPPRRIRKGFHRRQISLDVHDGLVETRKNLWQPLLYGGVLGSLAFGSRIRTDSIEAAVLTSLGLFFLLFVMVAGFILVCGILSYRLQRPLARSEYRFLPSLARWTLAVAAALAILVVMSMLSGAALVNLGPPAQFCRLYLSGWLESLANNLLRCTAGAVGFGLAIAVYERRHCFEVEGTCEV